MNQLVTLEDIRKAWASKDSELANLVVQLANQPDPPAGGVGQPTPREGARTFEAFRRHLWSWEYLRQPLEQKEHIRNEWWKAIEAHDAEYPLPDRLKLYTIVLELWEDGGPFERDVLLQVIERIPLKWGPWRALKRIFKECEKNGDFEIYGALAARFDVVLSTRSGSGEVGYGTLSYLVRRAWRTLRRQGESLPACYADSCVEVLRFYPDRAHLTGCWIANHIFFHESKRYSRSSFYVYQDKDLLSNRAFAELWRRTPRPLFTLLERGNWERALRFATSALKADFRANLREVEPMWVARLISRKSESVDEFVVWLLTNVSTFEHGSLRELGLHEPVLTLLDSNSNDARKWAASYARTHARDLPLEELIRLANNTNDEVRKLVRDILKDRDPRKDVGLEGWGQLLGTPHGHELATQALTKYFTAHELTKEWFLERLLSENHQVFRFASERLPHVYSYETLGIGFFRKVADDPRLTSSAAKYAMDAFGRFELREQLTKDPSLVLFLRTLLLNPLTQEQVQAWLEHNRIQTKDFGVDFVKALAFEGSWDNHEWIQSLRKSELAWAKGLEFNSELSEFMLEQLQDVRKFSSQDVGFDWLVELAGQSDSTYADFATNYMIKAFVPADFAQQAADSAQTPSPAAAKVDLQGHTFLFTGKMATLTRQKAMEKVSEHNGKNISSVSAKLNYLVIGDEGSPLFGAGTKGSKQIAADKLIEQGSSLKIISETAFLKMLQGGVTEASSETVHAGCERLWSMLVNEGPEDAPLRLFSLRYLRSHHPDICLQMTDRPVDPGADIPSDFLSFERVKPLLRESRETLRQFALSLAHWEFARWNPPAEQLVELSEFPFSDVHSFVRKALTIKPEKANERFRIPIENLKAADVYRFCESLDGGTRALGMQLIRMRPELTNPDELFRLTESPDRQIRAFVIHTLWGLYREKGITPNWQPSEQRTQQLAKTAKGKALEIEPSHVTSKPEKRPASDGDLVAFLRRILLTIPPGRLPKNSAMPPPSDGPAKKKGKRLRPIPARKAKLGLIEVLRDMAVDDASFAKIVTPVLLEFQHSRGVSEHSACLVALTRIQNAHQSKDANSWIAQLKIVTYCSVALFREE
jgi:hypothetical protein